MSRVLGMAVTRLPGGEILRFGIVGIAATLTHLAVLVAWVDGVGLPAPIGNGIAFLVALSVTYVGQSVWVFRRTLFSPRRMTRFLVSAVSGFLAHAAIMGLVVNLLEWHYLVGLACALAVIPAATFVLNKTWVFRDGI